MNEQHLTDLWASLTLAEREIVIYDCSEEDWPIEAWRKIVNLDIRDAKTGYLTPLGECLREQWEKVWLLQARERILRKRRGKKP